MKKLMSLFAVAACFALFLAAPAMAADERQANQGMYNTRDLIGEDVVNPQGEDLGDIDDFVIDLNSGRVLYAVLRHGGALGFGGKWFAVAPSAFKYNDKRDALILDVKEADLKNAQGFDANKWPTGPDARWSKQGQGNVNENKNPNDPAANKDLNLSRASAIHGVDIYNTNDPKEKLGDVYGLALDLNGGKVNYVAMERGGVAGVGAKYYAIPWNALSRKAPDLKPTNWVFTLAADKTAFDGQPGFDTKNWPAEADSRFPKAAPANK